MMASAYSPCQKQPSEANVEKFTDLNFRELKKFDILRLHILVDEFHKI